MALSWTNDYETAQSLGPGGSLFRSTAQPASADYTTGGYTINPAEYGFAQIWGMWLVGANASAALTTAVVWQYNVELGKLQAFVTGAASGDPLAETAAATDLSGASYTFLIFGN